jgi:hypothetical protein
MSAAFKGSLFKSRLDYLVAAYPTAFKHDGSRYFVTGRKLRGRDSQNVRIHVPNAARSCSETVNGTCAWKDEDGNQHFHPGFLALVKQLMAQPEGIPKLLKHHAENFLLGFHLLWRDNGGRLKRKKYMPKGVWTPITVRSIWLGRFL